MSEHMAGVESLREMGSAVLRYRRGGCDRVSDHMASVDTRARARAQRAGRDNDVGPPTCRGVWGMARLRGLVGVRQVLHNSRARPMAVALTWPRLAD